MLLGDEQPPFREPSRCLLSRVRQSRAYLLFRYPASARGDSIELVRMAGLEPTTTCFQSKDSTD